MSRPLTALSLPAPLRQLLWLALLALAAAIPHRSLHAQTTNSPPAGYTLCAAERAQCSFTGTANVVYGSGTKWTAPRSFTTSVACSNATFGDPTPMVAKSCYYAPVAADTPPAGFTRCAGEGAQCSFTGTADVVYGSGTRWTAPRGFTGGVSCRTASFGADPAPYVVKSCYSRTATADTPPAGYTRCAAEGAQCSFTGSGNVVYGARTSWTAPRAFSGGVACRNASFGVDPAPNVAKSCYYVSAIVGTPTTQRDAVRLAEQASFGPTEALVGEIRTKGPTQWVSDQMALSASSYTSGGTGEVHQHTADTDFCTGRGDNCWRDWSSSTPLVWDFYRNAVERPDQLRQRVALALQQMLVVSNLEVFGTYGLRSYQNMLLNNAFGNYREILRKVSLSPVMGEYLDNVNNDKSAPNENFALELPQLFALVTCELNADGSQRGGSCHPTYDNDIVREYAYALTGWTYPAGGRTPWGCWPTGANCQYLDGDMVPVASFHDTQARTLLAGVSLPSGHTPATALNAVLDSLMNHPNMAPFVGKQLIQHLVTSNPSPAYVQRVATAFTTGRSGAFGTGQRGDMKATVAAVLLDPEARTATPGTSAGRLREPLQLFTGVLRALNGQTDGDALGWWWGEEMRQHVFRSPSVFNFYPPDYPLAGTPLVGPAFGIHNANTALQRVNFINYLLFWNGSGPTAGVPNAVGTRVNLSAFTADAADPTRLVDRLSLLLLGESLPSASRGAVIQAVSTYTQQSSGNDYLNHRVRQAAYLIFASPQYQIAR